MVSSYKCDLYLASILRIHKRDRSPMIDNSSLAEAYVTDLLFLLCDDVNQQVFQFSQSSNHDFFNLQNVALPLFMNGYVAFHSSIEIPF